MEFTLITEGNMPMEPLALAQACDAYYECPRDSSTGMRIGPLAGYAGKDEKGRQFVGDVYIDFAMIEEKPSLMFDHVAFPLAAKLNCLGGAGEIAYCGAPEGGKALAAQLAFISRGRYFYPEKVPISAASEGERARTRLAFARHRVMSGQLVVLVEDVCNNFSTAGALIDLIEEGGGKVAGIACFLNRSPEWDAAFDYRGRSIPVVALWRQVIPQYRQDDMFVSSDVEAGNVVWQPKLEWEERMMPHMRSAR